MKKRSKKVKKFLFPGTALIASSYISLLFAIGALTGYLGIKFFDKKFLKTGKIEPLFFGIGNWEIHLHHWVSASLAIFAISLAAPSLSVFWMGIFGGLIFHDIYTDRNWYKVFYRKKEEINLKKTKIAP